MPDDALSCPELARPYFARQAQYGRRTILPAIGEVGPGQPARRALAAGEEADRGVGPSRRFGEEVAGV